MFNWLKKTAKKTEDTIEQAGKDLSDTSEKMQQVLDESSDSVKNIVKILGIALFVSILANGVNIFMALSKHKAGKIPTISIENLYLGGPKE